MESRSMTVAQLVAALNGQVAIVEQRGALDRSVTSVTDDSRAVASGSLFVAVKGERADGHHFVAQAVQGGAAAIVAQESVEIGSLPFVKVADSRKALGLIGSRFYGDPSARLSMIGVTGTNGKTTTTYLCKALLEGIGRHVGLIGTVGYQIGAETIPATHTTPGALELQGLLMKMTQEGLSSVVMEVSSHALAMDRTAGCEYDAAVFYESDAGPSRLPPYDGRVFSGKAAALHRPRRREENRPARHREYGRSTRSRNPRGLPRARVGLRGEKPG
jgi:UDP-N-acetylmuramoyl-L-alanyl-D-glutamate--2,6-diaminopimelate ligase